MKKFLSICLLFIVIFGLFGCSNEVTKPNDQKTSENEVVVPSEEVKYYSIKISNDVINGNVSVNKTTAKKGENIILTITPKNGYVVDEESIKYNDTIIKNNSFIMPDYDVVISVNFKKIHLVKYHVNGVYTAYANVVDGELPVYPSSLTNKYYMMTCYENYNFTNSFPFYKPVTKDTDIYCKRVVNFYTPMSENKPIVKYSDNIDILNNIVEDIRVTFLSPAYLGFVVEENQTIIISTDTTYLEMSDTLMFSLAGAYGEAVNGGKFTRLERREDYLGHSFIIMEFDRPGVYYVAVTYSPEAIAEFGSSFLTSFEYVFKATAMVDNGVLLD